MCAVDGDLVDALLQPSTLEERLVLLRDVGGYDAPGLDRLAGAIEDRVHTVPADAAALASVVLTAAEDLGLSSVAARVEYLLARVRAESGDLASALSLITSARDRYEHAGDPLAALRTDLGRMQVLDDLGDHEGAIRLGNDLLASLATFSGATEDSHALTTARAAALCNLGVGHGFLGEHARSLAFYIESESAYQSIGLHPQVAQQRANQGIEFLALGRAREARDALRWAADEFARSGDQLWAAKCLVHLADVHQHLGELTDAMSVLDTASSELSPLGVDAEVLRVRAQQASVYLAAGLYEESVQEAEKAISLALDVGMPHDEAYARLTKAAAHLQVGALAASTTEVTAAIDLFDRVGDRQFRARAELLRADIAERSGDLPETVRALDGAVAALDDGGWRVPLAWALLKQFDVSDAEHRAGTLRRCLEVVSALDIPELHHALAVRQARVALEAGDLDEAVTLLERAVTEVQDQGQRLPDTILRLAFRQARAEALVGLVDALVVRGDEGDLVRALLVSDEAKARTLVDLARNTVGSAPGPDPRRDDAETSAGAATLRELRERTRDLSTAFEALHQGVEAATRDAALERARGLETEIRALRVQASVAAGTAQAPRSPSRLARTISDRPPTLAYHCIGDDLVAFVVVGTEVRSRQLVGARSEVEVLVAGLSAQWSRFRLGTAFLERNHEAVLAATEALLGELHDLLITPVADLLDRITGRELVVVPDGPLHQVPFHALRGDVGHLLDRWTIIVSPITPSTRPAAMRVRRGQPVTVLAVPDERSPEIAAEASTLQRLFPHARVHIGADARFDRLDGVGRDSIVHLACHGLYRPDNPLFSALQMGDRWVTGAEVLDLDLRGALVTLSACESGRPGRGTAEPVGLAWSFLAAGASGIVVSQWVVDDAVTLELMGDMYQGLADGLAPADALRTAQRHLAARRPHPYYWAPFVYVAGPPNTDRKDIR